jgi:hypothetical protein
MKRFFILIALVLALVNISYAQNDVTKFMGIPVDGTKKEMIKQLKSKRFKLVNKRLGVLEGDFNGNTSQVYIMTNRNKVNCITVCDKYSSTNEKSVISRFNRIVKQFCENENYKIPFGCTIEDFLIPDSEHQLWYNIKYNDKVYSAYFIQCADYDIAFYNKLNTDEFISQYNAALEKTPEDLLEYNKGWLEHSNIDYNEFYNQYDMSFFDNTNYKFQDKDRAICFFIMCTRIIGMKNIFDSKKRVAIQIIAPTNIKEFVLVYSYINEYNESNGDDL